jgi:hypothetical protein
MTTSLSLEEYGALDGGALHGLILDGSIDTPDVIDESRTSCGRGWQRSPCAKPASPRLAA